MATIHGVLPSEVISSISKPVIIGGNDNEEELHKREAEETPPDDSNKEDEEDIQLSDYDDRDLKRDEEKLDKDEKELEDYLSKIKAEGDSGISFNPETSSKHATLIKRIDVWIKKLKTIARAQSQYDPSAISRRVVGAWGKEIDDAPPERTKKGEKLLIIIFDTSGSMDKNLMSEVSSEIVRKLGQGKIVTRVFPLTHDGIGPKLPVPVSQFSKAISRILPVGAGGSDFSGSLLRVIKFLKSNTVPIKEISGLIIISDFEIQARRFPSNSGSYGFRIPEDIIKKSPNLPILLVDTIKSRSGDVKHVQAFARLNSDLDLTIILDKDGVTSQILYKRTPRKKLVK